MLYWFGWVGGGWMERGREREMDDLWIDVSRSGRLTD